jgi:bilirubin oxidase
MHFMKTAHFLLFLCAFTCSMCQSEAQQSYNPLRIPDTLAGPHFNLVMKDTFAQLIPGNQTVTSAINGNFWGPTLIMNKGETVYFNIKNKLNDSTTLHWHGFHLPAVMDGGPHQIIPPGTVWEPYWKVTNNASTYWYHPHLHEMTEAQITKGLGGLIIVRDEVESALALPRTYGVDDIPLVLTDRDFNSSNQFVMVPYGDSMVVNGTLRAQHTVPAQVIRFRILNGAIERSYNIGFGDNRSFYVIGSDGGLLNAPVSVTRYLLHAGERIEILVDFGGQNGQSVDMKAFNSTLGNFVAGGENFMNGPFGNYLGKKDFTMVHFNVGAATAKPITAIPATLTNNVLLNQADAVITRKLTISDSTGVTNPPILGPNAFIINHKLFDYDYNNYTVPVGNTEIWQITSSSVFGHPFHIHDVEFNILSVNGVAPVPAQAGWKDVVFIPGKTGGQNTVVKFIAKFEDYADTLHPFMYHCHISLHEDEGMMGQFIVKGNPASGTNEAALAPVDFILYPNPAQDRLFVQFADPDVQAYYIRITDALGRTLYMLPQPDLHNGLDVSKLKPGVYFLECRDAQTKKSLSKRFVIGSSR